MALSVDSHPQKARIISSLLSGMSLRKLAATLDPPLHFASLQRYKLRIVRPALRQAVATAKVAGIDKAIVSEQLAIAATKDATRAIQASPCLDRVKYLWEKTEQGIARAETAVRTVRDPDTGEQVVIGADMSALAPLLAQGHRNAEIIGQLSGELTNASAAGTTTIYVLTPQCAVSFGAALPGAQREQLGPVVDVKAEDTE